MNDERRAKIEQEMKRTWRERKNKTKTKNKENKKNMNETQRHKPLEYSKTLLLP